MESNGAVVRELVQFVREQRDLNKKQDETNRELKANTQELKELHKSQDKWMRKMFTAHEDWMKNHEKRLVNLYKLVRR